jgi:hypothetical protein
MVSAPSERATLATTGAPPVPVPPPFLLPAADKRTEFATNQLCPTPAWNCGAAIQKGVRFYLQVEI